MLRFGSPGWAAAAQLCTLSPPRCQTLAQPAANSCSSTSWGGTCLAPSEATVLQVCPLPPPPSTHETAAQNIPFIPAAETVAKRQLVVRAQQDEAQPGRVLLCGTTWAGPWGWGRTGPRRCGGGQRCRYTSVAGPHS